MKRVLMISALLALLVGLFEFGAKTQSNETIRGGINKLVDKGSDDGNWNDPDWTYLRAFWTPGNSRIRHKLEV